MVDKKRVQELKLDKNSLLEKEEESLDENGSSKDETSAEPAKNITK